VVSEHLVARAVQGDEAAFRELTEPHRRELHVHCYRILGSMQDAEDAVQETMLRAWRGLPSFEGRASLRSWLYRIASNRCLDTLRDARRRPQAPETPFQPPAPTRLTELTWLEPYPDFLLEGLADLAPGPDARYETREAIELAFIAALQVLPPRQRAALILRDVLGFQTREVADILDSTEDSVKGILKRARTTLEQALAHEGRQPAPHPGSADEHVLVQRFADAWEADDIDTIVSLLTDHARLSMPPSPLEYDGREAIAGFLSQLAHWRAGRRYRLVPTRANTQPAFGVYYTDPHSVAHSSGVLVLTLEGAEVAAITVFLDSAVVRRFGLPRTLPK
jgi:RNA polymerase sigma-70 factor (TIGR02960 family)